MIKKKASFIVTASMVLVIWACISVSHAEILLGDHFDSQPIGIHPKVQARFVSGRVCWREQRRPI